jgi:hypothetical protein
MYKKIHLDIDFNHFLSQEIPKGSTCIAHQVIELKDIHEKFPGGFPQTYTLANTTIHQKFYTEKECDFKELGNKLGIEPVTVSTIMQPPGNVIPLHRDTFFKIKTKYPDNTKTIVRCNIYLEDWKSGHFLQYNEEVDTHWKQGDGHMWDSDVLHIGANVGMENKFTLQVSGFLR